MRSFVRRRCAWLFRLTSTVLPIFLGAALVGLPLFLPATDVAHAEADAFGLGSGQTGALTVTAAATIVNSYAQVTAPLVAGDTSVSVAASAGFLAGDLVMVLQTTGIVPAPSSGAAGPIDLSGDPVGRWELARLASAGGTTLALTAPLDKAYAASVSQVIRVPEYTTLTINAGASITAPAWNGATGGVLAFLASGTITNNGTIRATGLGFHGGSYVDDVSGTTDCNGMDEPAATGAQKGEGIANTRYGPGHTGNGNVANGGGGGVCLRSGGGGGGNGGAGGRGGNSDGAFDGARGVGGNGGTALSYSLLDHLTLGGGGGAGHGADGTGVPGGRGGGAIFIRGGQLAGAGTITASGDTGGASGSDGGSGGGAGGNIYLRIVGSANCGSISARGGIGGSVSAVQIGPGGGGAGGRVLFQSASGTCTTNVLGAQAGTQQDASAPGGIAYGAQSGANGIATTLTGGFVLPAVPTLIAPASGSVTNNQRPSFAGTAAANQTIIIFLDGVELVQTTSNGSGDWLFTPLVDVAAGAHQLQVAAEFQAVRSVFGATSAFTVDVSAPSAPVLSAPVDGTPTANNHPAIAGTAEPASAVTIYLDGAPIGTATASAAGNWSFTPGSALPDGPHIAKATATDPAGNTGDFSISTNFTVDTTPPVAPASITPADGATTYTATPTLNGAAEPGGTVTLYLDGVAIGTTTVDGLGNWEYTFGTSLAEGAHTIKVSVTDAAGNTSPFSSSSTLSYVPAQAPGLTSSAPAQATYGSTYNHVFAVTGAPTPTLSLASGALPPGLSLTGAMLSGSPTSAGSYGPITVKISNGYGADITQTFTFVVAKATLTATAHNHSRVAGMGNPEFTVYYSGFVQGDTAASAITGSPICDSTATPASPSSSYSIHCVAGTLAASNYVFSFVDGTLMVTSAETNLRPRQYLPLLQSQ